MLVDTQKIADLSLNGRFELLEALSSAFSAEETTFKSPNWHYEVLEQRKHVYNGLINL